MDLEYFLDYLEQNYETDNENYTFTALKNAVLELKNENKQLKEIIDIQRYNLSLLRKKK